MGSRLELESFFSERKSVMNRLCEFITKNLNEGQLPPDKLILGEAGSGKTTLLKYLYEQLSKETDLLKKNKVVLESLPATFSGEVLISLLQTIIDNVEEKAPYGARDASIILFIDDLDIPLSGNLKAQELFRAFIQNSSHKISIIASVRESSFLSDHNMPMYRFFGSPFKLPPLSNEELIHFFNFIHADIKNNSIVVDLDSNVKSWQYILTEGKPRYLRNLQLTLSLAETTEEFLSLYLNTVENEYTNKLEQLAHTQRALLEIGAFQGSSFRVNEMDFISKNIHQDASRLLQKGFLTKEDNGLYKFQSTLMKIWLRYIKHLKTKDVLDINKTIISPVEFKAGLYSI